MTNNRLTVPMRDGDEAEHRGYDVFAGKADIDLHALNGYAESLRFEPRDGEEIPGNLVTSDPGDPKMITTNIGSMSAAVAALVGNSSKYQKAHGADPAQLVLSEKALERRQRIVDELVPLLESALTEAGGNEMDRLRSSYAEKITVPLSGIKNKFGLGSGTKTFKGGESLLNETQSAFIAKRDEYLRQLEGMVMDALYPKLIEKGLLQEGESLCIGCYDDESDEIFVEINMPGEIE